MVQQGAPVSVVVLIKTGESSGLSTALARWIPYIPCIWMQTYLVELEDTKCFTLDFLTRWVWELLESTPPGVTCFVPFPTIKNAHSLLTSWDPSRSPLLLCYLLCAFSNNKGCSQPPHIQNKFASLPIQSANCRFRNSLVVFAANNSCTD